MTQVTHKQLKRLLKIYYGSRTPVYIWGTMGIGKSMVVRDVARDIAKELGQGFIEGEPDGVQKFGFIDIRISQLEPSDLRGLPNIVGNNEAKVTKWVIPNWLPSNPNSSGILFFDELNLAPQSIQASAYQLILDRRIGDYKLPDGWLIISAGNTLSDRANVYDLPAPLSNRFTHLELKIPSKDDWIEWALKNNVESSIIAFLEWKPSYIYKFDKNSKERAFPTPRSWFFCSNLINNSDISLEDKKILASSAVGEGVITELYAFLKLKSELDIDSVLKTPESVTKLTAVDVKYTLLSSLTDKYKDNKKLLEPILNVCNYLDAEFSILLLRFLKGARTEFKVEVLKLKIGTLLLNKYSKYLLDTEE